jgi:orotidine-5'-phosphate decarboxylase
MSIDKLQEKIRKMKNPSMVDFSVDLSQIPPHILEEESNEILAYERFCRELLDGLKGTVPAVRFNFGRFSLLGPDGLFLMSRMTEYAKSLDYYVLLDAPETFSAQAAELSVKQLFSDKCLWHFDGLVVSGYAGSDVLKPYVKALKSPNKDLFVVLRTANKSAAELQDLLTGSRLVHMAAADIVYRFCESLVGRSGYGQVAGVGPASSADVLKKLRARYKSLFLLVDGYDLPNANAKNCNLAFDKLGHGAVVCAGTGITAAWNDETNDGVDYVARAVEAAERMKKNLLRYTTVL